MPTDTQAPALVVALSDKPGDIRPLLDWLLSIAQTELQDEAVQGVAT